MYPLLQNNVYLFNRTFLKKTHYPIISICLFIIAVVLNSIQYHKNNNTYLQDKIIISNKDYPSGTTNISNTFLYIYDFIGINGFIDNTPAHIFLLIVTYVCLSLIELNIGHASLLFLLFINIMFSRFWTDFTNSICKNNLTVTSIDKETFCCGSFVLFMALGFVLFLLAKNIKNIYAFIFIICLIILIFSSAVLYDYLNETSDMSSVKTCSIFTWHGANYIFGILCALALGN